MPPVDEGAQDQDLLAFRARLIEIVAKTDALALVEVPD